MTLKGTRAQSTRELAVTIFESLKTPQRHYTLRPFNRFDVERSMWWIVPSTDYPAYKFGKFFVYELNGKFEVGLHVEKGLAKAVENKPGLALNDTWTWFAFMDALSDGEIGDLCESIQKSFGDDVEISVSVEIPDLIAAGDERGEQRIQLRGGGWRNERHREPADLRRIPDWISSIEGVAWYWVDVFVTFTLAKVTEEDQHDLSGPDIIRQLLEPLEKWAR